MPRKVLITLAAAILLVVLIHSWPIDPKARQKAFLGVLEALLPG